MMLKVNGRQTPDPQAAHKPIELAADRKSVFDHDPAGLPAVEAGMATHRNRIETTES
jgi:hypothetical protein